MIKPLQIFLLMLLLAGFTSDKAFAQFPYTESFMNATAANINFGGSPTALLTGGNIDANGSGFLRLTSNSGNQRGYAFSSNSFPSSKGISVSFEYDTYGGNGADGICFFLFDAATTDANFNIGSYGGGLGYTDISATGLSRAYLGIGLDEFGNFCTTNAGGRGPARTTKVPNSVTIRGAYNDPNGAYYMLNTVQLSSSTHGFSTIGNGTARVTSPGTGYRKAYIDILPNSSGAGFDITVKIQHDAVTTPVTIINNYYYSYASPANLKFGFAASTGGSNNYHEIRNTSVILPSGTTLASPTQTNQVLTACSNSTGSVDISSGFSTTNTPNGTINKASVDLDPVTSGIQTTYPVSSKGTFTSDGNGNILFTPLNSTVTGTASCSFTVADNYGATSNTATVTATINAAPVLTVTNPAAVCAPATVDLTAASVSAGSDQGLTLSYYTDAAATVSLSNPAAVTSSGTYYIKGTNANNCAVIKPVTVTINPLPATANAGSNQTVTTNTPAAVALNGNAPVQGTGLWSQVSGPTTAAFLNAGVNNTSVSNLNPGTYVFRWTITNNCGNSASDVTINIIGTQTITFNNLLAKAYADADFNAGASASSGLAVTYISSNPAVATVDASGNVHIISAGSTDITANQAGNTNYSAATAVTRTLTVNPAAQTITFSALPTKTYGDADFNMGASASSGLTVTYTSSNPAVATVDASGNVHIFSAGNTNITVNQAGNTNYSAAPAVTQNLVVNKASLQIIAADKITTYNTAIPALTVNYSGFLNGDTPASLTALPSISTTATAASPVGTYQITASGAAAANYNILYTGGTLQIFPGIQTITFTPITKYYGDPDFALTATASSGLPVTYSSSNTAIATVDANGSVHILSAGTVMITALQTGNGNYTATTAINQQITINKTTLTAAADRLNKTYGTANPALTVTYSGFVNGDDQTSLTTQPVLSTAATATSAVGTYPVTIGGAASNKYSINYQSGTLTVDSASQVITVNPVPVKTYGDADFVLGATSSSGLALTYESSNPAVANVDASGNVHILSAGNTTITAAQTGGSNFGAAAPVAQNLTVNKASLTVAAVNQIKTYGAVNPDLTVTYTGFVNGETAAVLTASPTISTTATVTSPAGNYPITIVNADADNYAITYVTGNLTVTKAALTLTADHKSKVYTLPNPPLTVSYAGFVNGETPSVLTSPPTVTTTATTTSAAGNYPITVNAAAAANYDLTFTAGTLTITNAPVTGVSLAQVMLLENQPAGTLAGTLSAASADPNASFTYSLVAGTGAADNALFSIQGNKLRAAASFDYETKSTYSVLIRATNQYGLSFDQSFSISLTDVNEAPTLAAIPAQQVCFSPDAQTIRLNGISAGPETAQTVTLKVSSTNPDLFKSLSVSSVSGGMATLNYQLAGTGTAVVTVTAQDNGGTANGGTDSFAQTFTITVNALPTAAITSDKGMQIFKGETITLSATGGGNYSWDTAPDVSGSSSSAIIQVRPLKTTTYQVKVSNASGCSTTASITVNVADNYQDIHPANILTPNGDGKNDTWIVKNIELYPDNTISIFDKGGRKLLEVKHYDNSWDGTFHGSPLAEGTYYYVIDFGAGKGQIKGFITIIRNR